MDIRIIDLDVGKTEEGLPVWQGFQMLGADTDDKEPFEGDPFQPLGFVSIPFGKDEDGNAEGVAIEGSGGLTTVYIGGRDTRCAGLYGNLAPGDLSMFAPHPNQASQVLLKGDKRQASLITRQADDTMLMVTLDGKNEKIQIAGMGSLIQITKDGLLLQGPAGAGLNISNGQVQFMGRVILSQAPVGPVRTGAGAIGGIASGTVFAFRRWVAQIEAAVRSWIPVHE